MQNPSTVLESLDIMSYNDSFELEDVVNILSASLLRNTKLKNIVIRHRTPSREVVEVVDSFDKVLCGVSSIESIYSSNHTLEDVKLCNYHNRGPAEYTLSKLTKECLELNKNANKSEVIHSKILQYYFVGDFDVGPFTSMPISVAVELMGQIKGDGKQYAIFRLLQSIPELCNISSRNDTGQSGMSIDECQKVIV